MFGCSLRLGWTSGHYGYFTVWLGDRRVFRDCFLTRLALWLESEKGGWLLHVRVRPTREGADLVAGGVRGIPLTRAEIGPWRTLFVSPGQGIKILEESDLPGLSRTMGRHGEALEARLRLARAASSLETIRSIHDTGGAGDKLCAGLWKSGGCPAG